jgi:hypothetical protein
MIPFPHHSEMSSETNTAIAARKEMKPNKPSTWDPRTELIEEVVEHYLCRSSRVSFSTATSSKGCFIPLIS